MPRPSVPPQRVELEGLVLRRLTPDDAPAIAEAAGASLEHLRPWMPWATPEMITVEAQRQRLQGPAGMWVRRGGYGYGAFLRDDDRLVGAFGLHRRIGPSALEIGYWVHVDHTRRGIATAGAGALTVVGFGLARVRRMEIHCDVANVASAGVPPKLGYRLAGTVEHLPEAPGEVGRRMVWVLTRREWKGRAPRRPG